MKFNAITEKALQKQIVAYFNWLSGCYARKLDVNGTYLSKQKVWIKNEMAGLPDVMVFCKHVNICVTLCLEVKIKYGKQNANQIEFEEMLKKVNGYYYVVKSLDEAKAAYEDMIRRVDANISDFKKEA